MQEEATSRWPEVALANETIQLLRAGLRDDMKESARDRPRDDRASDDAGQRGAVLADGLQHRARQQATEHAGRAVLGGIAVAGRKLFWAAVFAASIYSVLGWYGIKLSWKVINA